MQRPFAHYPRTGERNLKQCFTADHKTTEYLVHPCLQFLYPCPCPCLCHLKHKKECSFLLKKCSRDKESTFTRTTLVLFPLLSLARRWALGAYLGHCPPHRKPRFPQPRFHQPWHTAWSSAFPRRQLHRGYPWHMAAQAVVGWHGASTPCRLQQLKASGGRGQQLPGWRPRSQQQQQAGAEQRQPGSDSRRQSACDHNNEWNRGKIWCPEEPQRIWPSAFSLVPLGQTNRCGWLTHVDGYFKVKSLKGRPLVGHRTPFRVTSARGCPHPPQSAHLPSLRRLHGREFELPCQTSSNTVHRSIFGLGSSLVSFSRRVFVWHKQASSR